MLSLKPLMWRNNFISLSIRKKKLVTIRSNCTKNRFERVQFSPQLSCSVLSQIHNKQHLTPTNTKHSFTLDFWLNFQLNYGISCCRSRMIDVFRLKLSRDNIYRVRDSHIFISDLWVFVFSWCGSMFLGKWYNYAMKSLVLQLIS